MTTSPTNVALYGGFPASWNVQNVGTLGGGDQSLVSGGGAGAALTGTDKNGFIAKNFSVTEQTVATASLTAVTAGTLYLSKLMFNEPATVANLWLNVAVVAATPSHGFVCLVDASGNIVGATADLSTTAFSATGAQAFALASKAPVVGGAYFVGFYMAGGTALKVTSAEIQDASLNANTSAAAGNLAFSTAATGLTTALPASPLVLSGGSSVLTAENTICAWVAAT